MIKNGACCRCRMPIPINHLEFRMSKKDKPDGIWPICGNCASSWYDEISKHFLEWVKKGV